MIDYRLSLLLAAAMLSGCASVRPTIKCTLEGKAEVYQGLMGIGVGQELAEADSLCASVVKPARAASAP